MSKHKGLQFRSGSNFKVQRSNNRRIKLTFKNGLRDNYASYSVGNCQCSELEKLSTTAAQLAQIEHSSYTYLEGRTGVNSSPTVTTALEALCLPNLVL
eukprot:6180896-Pleurochrysis_carterae.AAC.1